RVVVAPEVRGAAALAQGRGVAAVQPQRRVEVGRGAGVLPRLEEHVAALNQRRGTVRLPAQAVLVEEAAHLGGREAKSHLLLRPRLARDDADQLAAVV